MSTQVRVTKSETKTTYGDIGETGYRAKVAPRSTLIHRTSYAGPVASRNLSFTGPLPADSYVAVTNTGVKDVTASRFREKKDMQDLNERFASYIEKVRFLEAQNRRLADELEKLKAKWGKETSAIKAMYQAELDEARRLLDEAEKDKAKFQINADSLEEQLNEMKDRLAEALAEAARHREAFENQNRTVTDLEAELALVRKRIDSLESDREKDKKEIARLTDALNRARIDLDNETLAHIDAENRRQTLEEEIEFLKQVHEQEMKELAALAYRDTTQENREFWKNEMGNALREIQATYDEKMEGMRGELETYYNLKLQEFRTGATRQNMETTHAKEETKRLRTQLADLRSKLADLEAKNAQLQVELNRIRQEYDDKEREWESENGELKSEVAKLRAEMECILKELQDLMDTKLGLELEIAAYRKLLEGEENRTGLKSMVDSWVSSGQTADASIVKQRVVEQEAGSSASSQVTMKLKFEKSAKGAIAIDDVPPNGQFLMLANNGGQEEALGGWSIQRTIDGRKMDSVFLKANFVIKSGAKVKLTAQEYLGQQTWGIGANVTTVLKNPKDEDRATHVQKTIYTS